MRRHSGVIPVVFVLAFLLMTPILGGQALSGRSQARIGQGLYMGQGQGAAGRSPGQASLSGCLAGTSSEGGNTTARLSSTGTAYWAASGPTGESGQLLVGYEIAISVAADNSGTSPASSEALVSLILSSTAYSGWGGSATSVGTPVGGVPIGAWTVYSGGDDGGAQGDAQNCLDIAVPAGNPYVTLSVSAATPVPPFVVSVAVTAYFAPATAARGCSMGTAAAYGGQEDLESSSGSTGQWASSDPSPVMGSNLTGLEASFSMAYTGSPSQGPHYTSFEAYVLFTPNAFTGWNSGGQSVTSLPSGALVAAAFALQVAAVPGSSDLTLSLSCLDIAAPSSAPYLSLYIVLTTTTAGGIDAELQTTEYFASTSPGSGCVASSVPKYGGQDDTLPSGQGEDWYVSSDTTSLAGQTLTGLEVSATQSFSGSATSSPFFDETLFWVFLSSTPYTSWNSNGQALSTFPSGTVVVGSWILKTGGAGDAANTAIYIGCLGLSVTSAYPYLSLMVNSLGSSGLYAEVQTTTYLEPTSGGGASPCSFSRSLVSHVGQEDSLAAAGSLAWYAASSGDNLTGDDVNSATVSLSLAGQQPTAQMPSSSSILVWMMLTPTNYTGNNGPGTQLTGFPPGMVLGAWKLSTGSAFGAGNEAVVLSCLGIAVPSADPFLTVMINLATSAVGNLDAEVHVMAWAEPVSDVAPCVSPSSLTSPGIQGGGQVDTQSASGIAWWVSSDPNNLSGKVITSLEFSSSMDWGSASDTPTFGEALVGVFLSASPYTTWNSKGQSLSTFPSGEFVGLWILKIGSMNTTAEQASGLSCMLLPVPAATPYVSIMINSLASSEPSLQTEVQTAVGVASLTTLSVKAGANVTAGDTGITSFGLSAVASGAIPPTGIAWNFGDGGLGTGTLVSHTYSTPGTYNATVWANDSMGRSASSSVTLTVNPAPSVTIAASPTGGKAPLSVKFTAIPSGGTAPYAYFWAFGDGNTSAASAPTHVYDKAGIYSVTLMLTDYAGARTNSATLAVSVTLPPTLVITSVVASPNPVEVNHTTYLNVSVTGGVPPYSFSYLRLPPGCSSSNTSNFSCTPSTTGNFAVNVTVSDSVGESNWSVTHLEVAPSTSPSPLSVKLAFSKAPVVVGHTTDINATASGGTPPYSFVYAGLPPGCSTIDSSTLQCTPSSAGSFNVSVVVTDGAGKSAISWMILTVTSSGGGPIISSVIASPNPVPVSSATKISVAVSGGTTPYSYSYLNLPPGCTSVNTNPLTCTPTTVGNYTVTVVVTDQAGLTYSSTLPLTVTGKVTPLAVTLATNLTSVQAGQSFTLTASATGGVGPYTYRWTLNGTNLTSVTGISSWSQRLTHPGSYTYTVWLTDSRGTKVQSAPVVVQVTPIGTSGTRNTGAFPWWIILLVLFAAMTLLAILVVARRRQREKDAPAESTYGSEGGMGVDLAGGTLAGVSSAPQGESPGAFPQGETVPEVTPNAALGLGQSSPEATPLTNCPQCTGPLGPDQACPVCGVRWESEPKPASLESTPDLSPQAPAPGGESTPLTNCPQCGGTLSQDAVCPACGFSWVPPRPEQA